MVPETVGHFWGISFVIKMDVGLQSRKKWEMRSWENTLKKDIVSWFQRGSLASKPGDQSEAGM